ncbi:hypothetical protein OF83DRAFT_1071807 [Amylostereum chailletii]|nr:hypothetical protein OF83DRAFT_1071807 [Amylostereum chailletii]
MASTENIKIGGEYVRVEEKDEDEEEDNDKVVKAGRKRKRGTHEVGVRTDSQRNTHWNEVAAACLDLPHHWEKGVWDDRESEAAIKIEKKLWEGQANEALDDLRAQLITSYAMRLGKRTISGVIKNTREQRKQERKRDAVNKAADRYRRARGALLELGMTADDKNFRHLATKDVVPFVVALDDEVLGQGKKQPSWLWGDFSFMEKQGDGVRKYCAESELLKVHWFRRRALCTRWEEEVNLLQEEMRCMLRFFRARAEWWDEGAKACKQEGKAGAAAYKKK